MLTTGAVKLSLPVSRALHSLSGKLDSNRAIKDKFVDSTLLQFTQRYERLTGYWPWWTWCTKLIVFTH